MANSLKILYVDDDKNALDAFCSLLGEETNYDIRVTESFDDGLRVLTEEQSIGLIFVGLNVLGKSGVEFLIQVSQQWSESIRILLARNGDSASVAEAVSLGQIHKIIPKPWSDGELKTAVFDGLQAWDLKQQNSRLASELKEASENLQQTTKQREILEIRNRVLQIAQGVLDVLPVAVFGIDANQMIVQCNDVACDLFPAGFMGPLGIDRRELFPADLNCLLDQAEIETAPSAALVISGQNFRGEVRRMDKSLSEGVVLALIPV